MSEISNKELLEAVQREFEALLQTKPTWGKNEVINLFEKAKSNALLSFM